MVVGYTWSTYENIALTNLDFFSAVLFGLFLISDVSDTTPVRLC